jgi:hypothetical protein
MTVAALWKGGSAMAQAVSRRPLTAESGFTPGSINVGLMVDKVALRQICLRILQFSPVSIIPPSFSIIIYHPVDEQYVR